MTGKRIAIILHNPKGSTGHIGDILTRAGHRPAEDPDHYSTG